MKFLEDYLPEKAYELYRQYKIEILLILCSLFLIVLSSFVFILSGSNHQSEIVVTENGLDKSSTITNKIFVHLSGSVINPDVYELPSGSRLRDVLLKAGGLSGEADRDYFEKNFNLAKVVIDQEKIYIPSREEVQSGSNLIMQKPHSVLGIQTGAANAISINTGSMKDLESLPGIGLVTAEKIISNRPYQSIDELTGKKVIGNSLYEKIKNLIVL